MSKITLPVIQVPAGDGTSTRPLPPPLARDPGDNSPPMVCEPVFDELCVLANGDIVCSSCDTLGEHAYGNVCVDRIEDVYNGPLYREIREWQLRSRPDFWCPAIYEYCPRRIRRAPAGYEADARRVKILKIESTTRCNIHCPGCHVVTHFVQDPVLRERRARKILPLDVMIDVVDQLPDLESLLYYNFGEPFLHKDTVPFLREVRKRRPNARVATSTNGLVLTPGQIEALASETLVDKIIFSIDGADPASYKKYRVGGELGKALGKLETLVNRSRAAGTRDRMQVIWRYILFEWNDSDEEIAQAKEIARNIGVPIEWFLSGTEEGASKRFLPGSGEYASLTGVVPYETVAAPRLLLERLREDSRGEEDAGEAGGGGTVGNRYKAHISADNTFVTGSAGERVLIFVDIENVSDRSWRSDHPQGFRLGVLLQAITGDRIRELPGGFLPPEAVKPGGRGTMRIKVILPGQPGQYQLLIDVVEDGVCWFHQRGSRPLVLTVNVG